MTIKRNEIEFDDSSLLADEDKSQCNADKVQKRIDEYDLTIHRFDHDVHPDDSINLDYTIAVFVIPRLEMLKKRAVSYPSGLTPEKWDEILDKMIIAFKIVANNEDLGVDTIYSKFKEGFDLFHKYFLDLWS